jgi:THUMP domain-like
VAAAQGLDLSPGARIRSAEGVRTFGPDLGPLALEQALLRGRARAKHPRGDELWWTPEALEQASSHDVASSRADRFDAPVLDLGCSVGGDLLTLPEGSTGVDLDEARLLLAAENARVLGRRVGLVRADVRTLVVPTGRSVFADPARRSGGRRTFDPRAYSPPLDWVLGLPARALGVKVAPGVDHEALPPELEVEVVSLRGEVKEAVLWAGAARRGARRTATLLSGAGRSVLVDDGAPVPRVAPPGAWLLEPDGAVVRAHLVAQVARDVDGWLLDATIAYVAAGRPVQVPWGRWYRVLETLPFSLKGLRERLRAHDAGPLVVKKRGTAVEPEVLRRRLKLTGSREVTVVLTRSAGRQVALVVEPVSPGAAAPAGR